MSCFGYALSKPKNRKSKVKPFSNIKAIHVYENKYKIRTVIPNDPTKTKNYTNKN
uniref:Uncharacterized protein n=1 Tax=viral metagenome TaxID=1070528 RepID=A0A6C0IRB3_9ZZZZ